MFLIDHWSPWCSGGVLSSAAMWLSSWAKSILECIMLSKWHIRGFWSLSSFEICEMGIQFLCRSCIHQVSSRICNHHAMGIDEGSFCVSWWYVCAFGNLCQFLLQTFRCNWAETLPSILFSTGCSCTGNGLQWQGTLLNLWMLQFYMNYIFINFLFNCYIKFIYKNWYIENLARKQHLKRVKISGILNMD